MPSNGGAFSGSRFRSYLVRTRYIPSPSNRFAAGPALSLWKRERGRYPRSRTRIEPPRPQQIQRPDPCHHRHNPKSTHTPTNRPHTALRPATGEAVQLATRRVAGRVEREASVGRRIKARQGLAEQDSPQGRCVEARPGPPGTPFGDAREARKVRAEIAWTVRGAPSPRPPEASLEAG